MVLDLLCLDKIKDRAIDRRREMRGLVWVVESERRLGVRTK